MGHPKHHQGGVRQMDKKRKLSACQLGRLIAKFEAMATMIRIGWCLGEVSPIYGAIYSPRPGPREIGDGLTKRDPFFRAAAQFGIGL